jgi:hypothetical protein
MILLEMIIQVAVGSVRHPLPEDIPNGTQVGIMAIGGDAVRRHPGYRPRRPKERLGGREVLGGTEPHIDEIPVSVNCPVEVLPLALDFDIRLVYIPAFAHGTVAPLA